jgi:hypothetical protein
VTSGLVQAVRIVRPIRYTVQVVGLEWNLNGPGSANKGQTVKIVLRNLISPFTSLFWLLLQVVSRQPLFHPVYVFLSQIPLLPPVLEKFHVFRGLYIKLKHRHLHM